MRYALFVGEDYYPVGGWSDFKRASNDKDELILEGKKQKGSWWHVVDLVDLDVVKSGTQGFEVK